MKRMKKMPNEEKHNPSPFSMEKGAKDKANNYLKTWDED